MQPSTPKVGQAGCALSKSWPILIIVRNSSKDIHFRLTAKRKNAAQHAKAGPLCARTKLQSRVEQIGIGRRELVDHHVAATIRKFGQLFRERPILASVAGAICALARLVRKMLVASAMVMRAGAAGASGAGTAGAG